MMIVRCAIFLFQRKVIRAHCKVQVNMQGGKIGLLSEFIDVSNLKTGNVLNQRGTTAATNNFMIIASY